MDINNRVATGDDHRNWWSNNMLKKLIEWYMDKKKTEPSDLFSVVVSLLAIIISIISIILSLC